MPGTSGPFVSVSLISKHSRIPQTFSAPASTCKVIVQFFSLIVFFAMFAATSFAQGVSDVTDVHITPRAKAEPANAVASPGAPDVNGPSVGLKTTERRIKVDVNLVLVPVTVTDPMNRLVTGLERENFILAEANQGQQIRSFSSEDAPLSLGVIFDLSGSMGNKLEKSKQAVVEFSRRRIPKTNSS